MIKATLFITSILLLHQAWLQTYKAPWLTLPDRANRPNHNRKDLLLSVTPDSLPIDTGSVYWIHVPTDRGLIRAAIATPTGAGPLPTVVILHGTHGFAQEYVFLHDIPACIPTGPPPTQPAIFGQQMSY